MSFDLAFKAVRARGRCVELTEAIGECRALAFCTAVQLENVGVRNAIEAARG